MSRLLHWLPVLLYLLLTTVAGRDNAAGRMGNAIEMMEEGAHEGMVGVR